VGAPIILWGLLGSIIIGVALGHSLGFTGFLRFVLAPKASQGLGDRLSSNKIGLFMTSGLMLRFSIYECILSMIIDDLLIFGAHDAEMLTVNVQ